MSWSARMTPTTQRLALYGALVGGVLGVVLQAPASWLGAAVAHVTQQRILLLNPQGTLWQGSAQWHLSDGQRDWQDVQQGAPLHSRRLTSPVQWQIAPKFDFKHMNIGLQLAIHTACCTPTPLQWRLTPTWQGLRIRSNDHASQWPAKWLVGLGAPWNTVQPDGQLQLRTQQFEWLQPWQTSKGQGQMQGQISLQWQHLSTRLSTLQPLGNYRLVVTGGELPQLQLNTLEGSLLLEGRGEWRQGRLRFRGEAKAQNGAETALSNLLNVLGQRRGNTSIMEIG
ncbi:MAG: type II secretion system protein N [Limnohabitans sp.]